MISNGIFESFKLKLKKKEISDFVSKWFFACESYSRFLIKKSMVNQSLMATNFSFIGILCRISTSASDTLHCQCAQLYNVNNKTLKKAYTVIIIATIRGTHPELMTDLVYLMLYANRNQQGIKIKQVSVIIKELKTTLSENKEEQNCMKSSLFSA